MSISQVKMRKIKMKIACLVNKYLPHQYQAQYDSKDSSRYSIQKPILKKARSSDVNK